MVLFSRVVEPTGATSLHCVALAVLKGTTEMECMSKEVAVQEMCSGEKSREKSDLYRYAADCKSEREKDKE